MDFVISSYHGRLHVRKELYAPMYPAARLGTDLKRIPLQPQQAALSLAELKLIHAKEVDLAARMISGSQK